MNALRKSPLSIAVVMVLLIVASCSPLAPEPAITSTPLALQTPSPLPTLTDPVVVTRTSVPSASPSPAPPTFTPLPPTNTALPTHTPSPEPSATFPPDAPRVNIYLIAVEDDGESGPAVGCDDSVVPVEVVIDQTQGVLRAALERLLSVEEQYYGESGLYNALYQSDLTIADVAIINGTATIRLSGELLLGGACDNPRVQAQLEQTALQFSTVTGVEIFLNDTPLGELLSGEG